MDKVKNVILDFGGVLINLMRCRCVNAFDQLGVSKVGIQLQTGFNRKDFLEQYELGNISTAEFRKGIRLSSGIILFSDKTSYKREAKKGAGD